MTDTRYVPVPGATAADGKPLVLLVDGELLAALARPPSHRAALLAEVEGRTGRVS